MAEPRKPGGKAGDGAAGGAGPDPERDAHCVREVAAPYPPAAESPSAESPSGSPFDRKDEATARKMVEALRLALGTSSQGRGSDTCVLCWCRRADHLPDHRGLPVICPLPQLSVIEQHAHVARYVREGQPLPREVDGWTLCRGRTKKKKPCRKSREPWSIYCKHHGPESSTRETAPSPEPRAGMQLVVDESPPAD